MLKFHFSITTISKSTVFNRKFKKLKTFITQDFSARISRYNSLKSYLCKKYMRSRKFIGTFWISQVCRFCMYKTLHGSIQIRPYICSRECTLLQYVFQNALHHLKKSSKIAQKLMKKKTEFVAEFTYHLTKP